MELTKGEERSAGQTESLFGPPELESQRSSTENRKKRINHCKIISGVLLLCFLVVLLAVVISTRMSSNDTDEDIWLTDGPAEVEHQQCPPGFDRPPLILVSLDGFRARYLEDHRSHIPVIKKLRNAGTSVPYIRPVYPTKTFPNHYSIVTGLYPESHGIVDNKMYDVTRNTFFSLKTKEKFNAYWYQGEPIWITAMRQKMKTGTVFWPGSDVAINGTFPNYYKQYDKSMTFERRVAALLGWLSLPQEERPDFYTLYLDEPDSTGHYYGPESHQLVSALENVDRILGKLMDGLKARNLSQCANIIIVSDHGMETASCERASFISSYQLQTSDFSVIQGPAARIRPKRLPEDYFSFDYEGLVKNLSCRTLDQPMRPYLKENLPKRMHFASNKRIERGHLYMKSGWQAALNRGEMKYCTGGFHGSDNLFPNMQAIFIGYGPGFKTNTVATPFENIEIYNLMCVIVKHERPGLIKRQDSEDLLGIRPALNNGTHGTLNHLLKQPVYQPVHPAQRSHDSPCEAADVTPTDRLQCNCSSQTMEMELEMNKKLLKPNLDKASLRRLHHPFGIPRVVQSGATFCLLHHKDYLSGYSKDHLMPLWVSYTVQPLTRQRPMVPESDSCVRADVRVPPNASQLCRRYRDDPDLSYGLLHPQYLNASGPETDSLISSNMAPMFPAFKHVWNHFHYAILPKYSQQANGLNIISGPIFDKDFDGNVDPNEQLSGNKAPIPTHFFLILTSCQNSTLSPPNQCEGLLEARAFILPHRPDYTEVCKDESDLGWVEEWLQFHTARVRDVELLTGLSFYHDRLSVEETLQLKTFLYNP